VHLVYFVSVFFLCILFLFYLGVRTEANLSRLRRNGSDLRQYLSCRGGRRREIAREMKGRGRAGGGREEGCEEDGGGREEGRGEEGGEGDLLFSFRLAGHCRMCVCVRVCVCACVCVYPPLTTTTLPLTLSELNYLAQRNCI
jgi:hypothetical protein